VLLKRLNKFWSDFSDFFIGRECEVCEIPLSSTENVICNNCLSKFQFIDSTLLENKFHTKSLFLNFTNFYSLFNFYESQEIKDLIHKLKYSNKIRIGEFFGEIIAEKYRKQLIDAKIDFLIPVPLHPIKQAERGYNQSYWISKGISKISGIKIKNNFVKRIKYTETQTHLNLHDRKLNVENAFKIKNHNQIKGKIFAIVDDVVTTGSTTSEIAKKLFENEVKAVYLISIAIPLLANKSD